MPTGYTCNIGKGITFEQFILGCARNFGALISMRDDPMDAPIPDEFKPSDYHVKELEQIESSLQDILSLTPEQWTERANQEYDKEVERLNMVISDSLELKGKYIAMLSQVKAWTPPSPDHEGLKQFMVEQIESSIRFDCPTEYYEKGLSNLKRKTGQEWRDSAYSELLKHKAYHTKENIEEISRVAGRNTWIKLLKDSLKEEHCK